MYEEQDLKLVGSRIKAVRISRGMSQADLAVEASVSLPLISNIERGKTGMQLETFVKVAEALQVSADYLLRPDVPEVKAIYQGEFAELLEDCSASEMETILKIVREVKASIQEPARRPAAYIPVRSGLIRIPLPDDSSYLGRFSGHPPP